MREYRNIKLVLTYDGSAYYGWQKQKNSLAVQSVLESGLRKILGERISAASSGRTDSGVHAESQVVSFKTKSTLAPDRIKKALNSILPYEIRVKKSEQVELSFHARYSAKSKIYRYRIFTGEFISPFMSRYVWHLPVKLDYNIMLSELNSLLGKHDFSNFKASGSSVKDNIRTVCSVRLNKKGNLYDFYIEADGFLYKMVRIIIGTIVEIGRGKFDPGRITDLLNGGKIISRGPAAPAKGLFLWRVIY